jgi:hypothetical protein
MFSTNIRANWLTAITKTMAEISKTITRQTQNNPKMILLTQIRTVGIKLKMIIFHSTQTSSWTDILISRFSNRKFKLIKLKRN